MPPALGHGRRQRPPLLLLLLFSSPPLVAREEELRRLKSRTSRRYLRGSQMDSEERARERENK